MKEKAALINTRYVFRTCTSRSLKRWQIEGKKSVFLSRVGLNISLTGHFVCATTSTTTITATTITTHDNNNNIKYTPTTNKIYSWIPRNPIDLAARNERKMAKIVRAHAHTKCQSPQKCLLHFSPWLQSNVTIRCSNYRFLFEYFLSLLSSVERECSLLWMGFSMVYLFVFS